MRPPPPLPHAPPRPGRHLPDGLDTVHHALCGCQQWVQGQRMADLVDVVAAQARQALASQLLVPTRPLRIAYALPHHNITGGMKCLVEHIRLLRQRGHHVVAVHRSDSAASAMPPWTDVRPDADIVCNLQQRLNDVYDVSQLDVVVVGIFHQVGGCWAVQQGAGAGSACRRAAGRGRGLGGRVGGAAGAVACFPRSRCGVASFWVQVAELLASVAAPVVYWEQGHEWLFGDPIRLQVGRRRWSFFVGGGGGGGGAGGPRAGGPPPHEKVRR